MGIFDFLFKKEEKVDEALQKQLETRGIKEATPEAVKKAREPQPSPFSAVQSFNVEPLQSKATPQQLSTATTPREPVIKKKQSGIVKLINDLLPNIGAPIQGGFTEQSFKDITRESDTRNLLYASSKDIESGIIETAKLYTNVFLNNFKKLTPLVTQVTKLPPPVIEAISTTVDQNKEKIASEVDNFFIDVINKVEESREKDISKLPQTWQDGNYKQIYRDGEIIPYLFGSAAPYIAMVSASGSVAGIAGLGVKGQTLAASLVGSTAVAGMESKEAREAGSTTDEQLAVNLLNGGFNFVTEYGAFGQIFKRDKVLQKEFKNVVSKAVNEVKQIVKAGAPEGVQEVSQNVFADATAKFYYDNERDIIDNLKKEGLYQGAFGFFLGSGSRGVQTLAGTRIPAGLSIEEDLTQINRKFNEENAIKFKTDAFLGNSEDKRADNKPILDKIINTGIVGEDAKSDSPITVYRAAKPKDLTDTGIQPGDFITTDEKVANKYLEEREGSIVQKAEVQIKDLIDYGGTNREFIYLPKSDIVGTDTPSTSKTQEQRMIDESTGVTRQKEKITMSDVVLLKKRLREMASASKKAASMTKQEIKGVQRDLVGLIEDTQMTPTEKAKFTRLIVNTQTTEQFNRVTDKVYDRINKAENRIIKNEIKNKITKQFNALSNLTKGKNKSNTKYDAVAQDLLQTYKDTIKLSTTEAQNRISRTLERAKKEGRELTYEEKEKNRIMSEYSELGKSSAIKHEQMLDEITTLVEDGYVRRLSALEQKNTLKQKDIDDAISTLTAGKGLTAEEKGFSFDDKEKNWRLGWKARAIAVGQNQVDFEGIGNMLSTFAIDKKTKDFFKKLNYDLPNRNAEMAGLKKQVDNMRDIFAEVYEINDDTNLVRKQDEMNNEIIYQKDFKNAEGTVINYKLTKSELMYYYAIMQNENARASLGRSNGFTKEFMSDMESTLEKNSKDKLFVERIMEFYSDYYDRVNVVFRDEYGKNLPKTEKYVPVKRELVRADQELGFGDFMNVLDDMASLSPSAFKERFKKSTARIKKSSILDVTNRYTSDMEHWIAWNKLINRWRNVYNDPTVSNLIEKTYGKQMNRVIKRFVDNATRGSIFTYDSADGFMWLKKNFTRSKIIAKPTIMLKQMVSQVAYAEKIPLKDYIKYSASFLLNPIDNIKFLKDNSLWFKNRSGNIDKDIIQITKTKTYKNAIERKSFWDMLSLNVKLGDQGAIAWGGYALYKSEYNKNIREGLNHETAHSKAITSFEEFSTKTQQSAFTTDLSYWQNSGNPFMQLFTIFKTSPNQYFRKELMVLRKLFTTVAIEKRAPNFKEMQKMTKTMTIYHFILPMLFQWVSDGFTLNEEEQKRAAMLGTFNGILIWGNGVEYLLRKMLDLQLFEGDDLIDSTVKDIGELWNLKDFDVNDFTWDEVWEAMYDISGATDVITGAPTKYGVDLLEGIYNIAQADYVKGGGHLLGYSNYILDQRDGLNKMLERSKTQPVKEQDVKLEIQKRFDNNKITEEQGDKFWEKYLDNQDKYYASKEFEAIDEIKSEDKKQKYFEELTPDLQENVMKLYEKKDKDKASRIRKQYEAGDISKEEADAKWAKWEEENWMPE